MQEKHNLRRCAKLLPTKLALESKSSEALEHADVAA
jgi:hypothetical protein